MAKRRTESASEAYSDLEPSYALQLLRKQLEAGEGLANLAVVPPDEYTQWKHTTEEFISASGPASINVTSFQMAGNPVATRPTVDPSSYDRVRKSALTSKIAILKSCIDQLEAVVSQPANLQAGRPLNDQIFLVHGRNEGIRETVARFLESLGLPVTILHEQPNRGQTIVEKFEEYSDVGFAVVLLTGDDRGGLADRPPETLHPRARQNVILELGFFLGKIGRDRVCALYELGVEIPSDYSGVLFVELDANRRWQVELAKELKAAGFYVDMNRLLK